MSAGLETTIEVLTATLNEAAVDVLLRALDSPHRAIQEKSVRALIDRRSQQGQRELVRRWHTLDNGLKGIITQRPGRIQGALREAILGRDAQACRNALDAVLWVKEYDLLPALLTTAEDREHPLADEAARTLLALADLLYEEIASPRDYRIRRDPQLIRQRAVTSLELSVERYGQHKRREVLDAFLMLANREDATLKRILLNPHDRVYLPLIEVLSTSTRPGVMRLLLAYLEDQHAPYSALNTLAHRTDEAFLRRLLKKVSHDPSAIMKANLKRIETIAWLREDLRRLLELDETEQQAVVQLAVLSGMKRLHVFEVVQFLLVKGNVGGRRAASHALAEFRGAEANQLVLQGLADADPQVQVNILLQLRERGIPSAMTRLLELIESPHLIVRQAAQQCLAEFSFKRYLAAFDLLAPQVRQTTGALVRKVDPETIPALAEELLGSARTRKMRALEIVECLGVARDVEEQLIELLKDEDHFIRLEAAQLLAACDTAQTRQALRGALLDRNASVQEAAERSLRALAQQGPVGAMAAAQLVQEPAEETAP